MLWEIIADEPFGSGTAAKAEMPILSSGGTYTETQDTGLWHMQKWLSWNQVIGMTIHIWNKIYEPATSHIVNSHKLGPCKQNPLYSTMHYYIILQ